MKKGIFCISIDTELLWGRHDLRPAYKEFVWRAEKERAIIKKILALFKKYKIDATWAIVGHLFLNRCRRKQSIKHSEIVRPRYDWLKSDWFSEDPCSSILKSPQWYGEDIVDEIKGHKTQEIGSHSFSHILFGLNGCTVECAESEIKTCIQLAKEKEVEMTSFIFPRNSVGHLDILRKYGFRSFRSINEHWYDNIPYVSKILAIIDLFIPIAPSVYIPRVMHGMIDIPASMYFVSARGLRKYIPRNTRFQKAKLGLDRAIEEKKVFHLWTHPTDFVDNMDKLFLNFEEILKYAAKKRDRDGLEIKTMSAIADLYI